jgi:hypothetical protein
VTLPYQTPIQGAEKMPHATPEAATDLRWPAEPTTRYRLTTVERDREGGGASTSPLPCRNSLVVVTTGERNLWLSSRRSVAGWRDGCRNQDRK